MEMCHLLILVALFTPTTALAGVPIKTQTSGLSSAEVTQPQTVPEVTISNRNEAEPATMTVEPKSASLLSVASDRRASTSKRRCQQNSRMASVVSYQHGLAFKPDSMSTPVTSTGVASTSSLTDTVVTMTATTTSAGEDRSADTHITARANGRVKKRRTFTSPGAGHALEKAKAQRRLRRKSKNIERANKAAADADAHASKISTSADHGHIELSNNGPQVVPKVPKAYGGILGRHRQFPNQRSVIGGTGFWAGFFSTLAVLTLMASVVAIAIFGTAWQEDGRMISDQFYKLPSRRMSCVSSILYQESIVASGTRFGGGIVRPRGRRCSAQSLPL